MVMMTAEDVQDDLERMDYGDPEIRRNFERLRSAFKSKGLPYRELARSKTFGSVKYILQELHDELGTVLVTDMDTNQTYQFIDPPRRQPDNLRRLQDWIKNAA